MVATAMSTQQDFDTIVKTSNIEPRNYQANLVQKATGFFEDQGVRGCMIESPTGSGKTCMGLLTAKLMQKRHNIGIGWVTMRRALLAQAVSENQSLGINVEGFTPISMFEKIPPKTDKQGRKIELLVVDEAQHDAANSSVNIHNTINPRWTLGLIAIPFR